MLDDIVKAITEMIWGESMLEMGFWKFFFTFVIIFVCIRAYIYLIEGDDENKE